MSGEMRDGFSTNNKYDLIELIFSSSENPIITMSDGKPVYQKKTSDAEKDRQKIHKNIESGAIDFVHEVSKRFNGENIFITQQDLFNLVRIYVQNPSIFDIREMYKVKQSPHADNKKYIPLFSAPIPFWKIKDLRNLPWLNPMQKFGMIMSKPLKIKVRGLKQIKIIFFPKMHYVFKFLLFGKYGIVIGSEYAR